ncbi:MAG: glycosyltransferase family 2 protein, partial [Eubacterium sp.]|nr:glycosyltransferase family 2 protein [Eubacterium sp.]
MTPKVSVIIPVYNAESYLKQCLDSVVNQTLTDIEVICIDDGSTDASYEICKKYASADSRFQLYQQKNLYAGTARNNGIRHASGDYLIFWDSDDFFELNALEELYKSITKNQADIAVCKAYRFLDEFGKGHIENSYCNMDRIPEGNVFNRTTNEQFILNFTSSAAWNKMFSRSFIDRWKLEFQPSRTGNDFFFVISALCLAERISIVPVPLV